MHATANKQVDLLILQFVCGSSYQISKTYHTKLKHTITELAHVVLRLFLFFEQHVVLLFIGVNYERLLGTERSRIITDRLPLYLCSNYSVVPEHGHTMSRDTLTTHILVWSIIKCTHSVTEPLI